MSKRKIVPEHMKYYMAAAKILRQIESIPATAKIGIDIARLKNIVNSLEYSYNKYRQLFENNNDAIFIADVKTRRLVDCNKQAEKVSGYSRDKILSMRADQMHPADVVRNTMAGFKAMASGSPIFVRSEILTKRGYKIPVEVSGTLLRLGGKNYLMGVFRDLSERNKAEDNLRQSEERYRTLAEMAEDPIYIIDRVGRIDYVNSFGAAYFSKRPTDMIGKRISDFFKPKYAGRMMKDIKKVFKTGKSVFAIGEFEFHGSKFWLDTRLSPVYDGMGNAIKVMGVSRDVTSHHRAEEVLERDNVKLEKIVVDSSKKLFEARNKLDRAERLAEIGTLSATVAHELRSPLAAIGIAAYNIRAKNKDPRLNNNIRNIEIKVLESDHIIKNLLLYSGRKSPLLEYVRISDLLDECIDLTQARFPDYNVRIPRSFRCSHNVALEADPVQLQGIFTNILNNSYESFSNKRGTIKVAVSVTGGDLLKIVFADNGSGIEHEKLGHMFEPFYSTKRSGTGLGLTLCKQIIELHSGRINVASSPGKGTTVTIYLPLNNKERV